VTIWQARVSYVFLNIAVLINGPEERTIPGNALSVHPDLPFRGLERFGVSFLSRFEGSQMPSSVLRSINLVDTPGVLSGEKQRTNRGYDFTKVVAWFAEVRKRQYFL
jgi:EH domain-containing protein 1